MFIKSVQKRKAGTNENPMYFRLCESYRDSLGKTRQRMIIALGYMEDLPRRSDKQELCRCLNDEKVTVKVSTLTNIRPQEIGAEHVALSCIDRLKIDRFLAHKCCSVREIQLAKLQIAALHPAIPAYWVISCSRYQLKKAGIHRRKFVWYPERPPKNMAADLQAREINAVVVSFGQQKVFKKKRRKLCLSRPTALS